MGSVGDTVVEAVGGGRDTVRTDRASYLLGANPEDLACGGTLAFTGTGNALDYVLTGGGGSDTLDGSAGADRMIGGAGDDTYIVYSVGDLAVEEADEGNDLVKASVSCSLGANVKKLTLTGKAHLDGSGNALANSLTGRGQDRLQHGRVLRPRSDRRPHAQPGAVRHRRLADQCQQPILYKTRS